MVIRSFHKEIKDRAKTRSVFSASLQKATSGFCVLFMLSACGTSDKARLKESRDAFVQGNFVKSEASLYSPEIYENEDNRLLHYYLLASVGMSEGLYEKAIYFLNKARDTARSVRADSGSFDWFGSKYVSNPIEYSYIHYFLSLSYTLLAEAGKTPAWSTPEMKDSKGNVIMPVQNFPEQVYDPRTISEYRQKARAELLAWDSHLQDLKRSYSDKNFYQEDLWSRLLASYTHSLSSDNNERRTAELLAGDAEKILNGSFKDYPSIEKNRTEINEFIQKLEKRATSKNDDSSLFVVEAGVLDPYKIKRFNIGLSTLLSNVKDPHLRSSIELVGLQVILQTAPEFGLVMASGALVGALSGGSDDDDDPEDGPPRFFSDAVDRGMGFQISFPSLVFPPSDTQIKLVLSQGGVSLPEMKLPVVSPIQEIIATELKNREKNDMFKKAVGIGLEYLAALVPAIITYHQASKQGNILKKVAAVAGFFIAKKVIDRLHQPDIRSWSFLPKLIAANVLKIQPGDYDAKIIFENSQGRFHQDLGLIHLGDQEKSVFRARVGQVDLLKTRTAVKKIMH